MNKKKINIKIILDYILVFLLCILSIKKGGFFKSDTILFNLGINIISIILIIYKCIKKDYIKIFDLKIGNLLLFLSLSYMFPIILKNYTSLNDSVFEMIRYFNIYLIYTIVKNSNNKNIYINAIIFIGTILCLFGIDQLGNGCMTNLLNLLNSGYLISKNIDRMSSTIQYANVFALICFIGNIFLIEKYKNNENIKKELVYNVVNFVLTIGIILSQSRIVIIMYFIYTIIFLIKNKKLIYKLLPNYVYTAIYVGINLNNINNLSYNIYIFFAIALFFNVIINILYKKVILEYINKIKFKSGIKKLQKKYIVIFCTLFIVFFMIMALNIHESVIIDANANTSYITRNIYKLNKNKENEINIKIEECIEDTRYEIEIFEVNEKNEFTLVDKLYYYSTNTGEFNIKSNPIQDIKYINININCTKGKLKILDLRVNDKKYTNYLLLPSNIIYRYADAIHSNPNLNYRINYIKDALKIWKSSVKNIFFGIGGEGFRNEYNYYKVENYNSTEVHNIYIQILLESGIIGFITFSIFIICIIKNYKLNYKKIAIFAILIHGLFDLDFSYMVMLAIFTILTGILDEKEVSDITEKNKTKINEKNLKILKIMLKNCIYIIVISLYIMTTVILFRSNLACFLNKSSILENDSLDIIGRKIEKYEKVVNMDNFETSYRINLNKMYDIYLEKLFANLNYFIDASSYNNIVNNIEINLNYLQKNESDNISNLIEISNDYFNNMENFINAKYKENKEEGYDYYLNIVYTNILKLYNVNNNELRDKAINISKRYLIKLNELDFENIQIIKKYKLLLENIV